MVPDGFFNVLSRADAPEWILEGDIKGCFDHLSHRRMLALSGIQNNLRGDPLELGCGRWRPCNIYDNLNER